MANSKSFSEIYDILYNRADSILKACNLCQFEKGECRRDRYDPLVRDESESYRKNGCCSSDICEHLGQNGCKVKSLRCKTFVCEYLKYHPLTREHGDCIAALNVLDSIALEIFNTPHYQLLGYYKSKEETLEGASDEVS